ncbi:MAG: hypothetical protein HYT76_03355 [Deltaproteobacteria bacterium]|nr:hypothetical protein [Deltaproteobacteria bacterium]
MSKSPEDIKKILLLLKLISQGVLDAEAGRSVDHQTLFNRLEKKLQKLVS